MKFYIFNLLFCCLLCLSLASQSAEVNTSFEFNNTSGSFTLTEGNASVTFIGGEARSVGNFSLYHTGLNAWMVAPGTPTSWTEVNLSEVDLGKPIAQAVLRNESGQGFAVLDDFAMIARQISTGERLDDPIPESIQGGSVRVRLKPVASGLTAPNWAFSAQGDPMHLYVGDQDGKLWRVDLADNSKAVFLDLSSVLIPLGAFGEGSFDERGFLGFALHPQFIDNGLLYTYTSEPADEVSDFSTIPNGVSANHQTVIREWHLNQASLQQNPAMIESQRILLTVDQPQFNHNAGALNFGPDGMLYIALGDGGGADDRDGQTFAGEPIIGHGDTGNGQNTSNPLGSLLRIDPAGNNSANGQYGIPQDNPFAGSNTVLGEIYAFGFRNPFRFSFDVLTGALVVADVGQNDIEEVNLVTAGGNYGWPVKEGSFRFDANGNDAGFVTNEPVTANVIDPVAQYDHDEGTAIIGGFVYRGRAISALQQAYVFGDASRTGNGDGRLLYTSGNEILEIDLTERSVPGFWVLGFGQDANGEIYVLGNTTGVPFESTGAVYKLVPNASFQAGTLTIPAVDVIINDSSIQVFSIQLRIISGSNPLRFELSQVETLSGSYSGDNSMFDAESGTLTIPYLNLINADQTVSTYAVEMSLLPDQSKMSFELRQVTLVK